MCARGGNRGRRGLSETTVFVQHGHGVGVRRDVRRHRLQRPQQMFHAPPRRVWISQGCSCLARLCS